MTLLSRPVPSSPNNPCPVCNGTDRNCRILEEVIFCHTFQDARQGEKFGNFICLRQSNGHTATFKIDNSQEWSEERKLEWEAETARRKERAEEQRRNALASQLPAIERDKAYKSLLAKLSLSETDRHKLLERGFTPSVIAERGYKTAKQWQLVDEYLPANLPGILLKGFGVKKLNLFTDGIICPIRDKDGLIVALKAHFPNGDPKYFWLTSATQKNLEGATPHLDGEIPLAVFEPDMLESPTIWLTEGVEFKPALASLKLGVPVLGASGGWFSSSPETAKASIEYLAQKYRAKVLTFAIDAGDVVNVDGVPERWLKQFEFFHSLGYTCQIAWWGQVTKEHDDIDELADLRAISYITPDEFKAIVDQPQPQPEVKPQAKAVENPQQNNWALEWWFKKRKFTPHIKVNQPLFHFPDIPESDAIIAVKSGLGTFKTGAMLEEIKRSGRPAMLIGYRNNLLFQTINRGEQFDVSIYHLREDDGQFILGDDCSHQAFCLDSILRVDGYFSGRDIYLDETCSVLLHAINGGTLGDGQAKVIKIFTRALNDCNRVFLLDGNLSDEYVNFIARLVPNKQVIKIGNQRPIAPHNITFVKGIDVDGEIKQRDRSPLLKELLKPDIIPWVYSDSKERTKILDKLFKDAGKIGYVLNSETAGEDWAKEFLANPDKFIQEKKPQYIIISPTAESGVSVTIKDYFTHKFTFFAGVAATNSQHQAMFRLRDDSIPHYVFCPERSMIRDRSTPHTYSTKRFIQEINERIMQSAILASHKSENPARTLEVIGEAIKRQNDDWWAFSAELGAVDNFEMDNLEKCLIHALEEAGHKVSIEEWDVASEIKEAEKAAKEYVQREHVTELFNAVEFDSTEEAKQKAKANPRKPMQRKIEKTFLLDKLPGIKDTEQWTAEFIYECHIKNKHFITQQQRYWLVKNFEISQKRHEVAWFYQATGEDFFSARVRRMGHDVIWALRELNILQFENLGEYHKNTPEVILIIQTLRDRKDIQLALNMRPEPETDTGNERLRILNNLLNYVGLKNKGCGKKFVGTVRLRHYLCEPIAPGQSKIINDSEPTFDFTAARKVILGAIDHKFTAWFESDKSQINWESNQESQEPIKEEPPVTDQEKAQWLTEDIIQETANMLAIVEDSETLLLLRQSTPDFVLRVAVKRLPEQKQRVLKEWVIEQNKDGDGFRFAA
jgi:hypothetical protein